MGGGKQPFVAARVRKLELELEQEGGDRIMNIAGLGNSARSKNWCTYTTSGATTRWGRIRQEECSTWTGSCGTMIGGASGHSSLPFCAKNTLKYYLFTWPKVRVPSDFETDDSVV